MTEAQFISQIQGEITGSGALPVVVNEPEIKRIIKQESKYFFENYEFAVEKQVYVIEKQNFNNQQYRNSRVLILPDCVVSVVEFKEINGVGRLGNIDRDFAEDRLIASEIFLSSFHGDDLVFRTAQYQYFDLSRAFFLESIAYKYNRNTNRLKVEGRDPKFDVFMDTWVRIPMDKLYEDYYFTRWVTAKAKISFARIVGMYPFPLPGNVTINTDMMRTEGEQEIEQLRTEMDTLNVPDWILVYH